MNTYRFRITPRSAFGSRFSGDTLFGQLCWAIRNRLGEQRLVQLLQGYTEGSPFLVASDALPAGHLPRPVLPSHWFSEVGGLDRKEAKKRAWLPLKAFGCPVSQWLVHCVPATKLAGAALKPHPQPHNSINRATNTTGAGFDPYSMEQLWYGQITKEGGDPEVPQLDLVLILDESRLTADELQAVLTDVGTLGFGRDASIGLGKFEGKAVEPWSLPAQDGTNAWLTLAPCAPQGLAWDERRCFYQPFTRFGRHGDIGVHLGNPFKTPVLLADTGAVLTLSIGPAGKMENRSFIGQGLGGTGRLSKARGLEGTVHQGYAPVVGIKLPEVA